MFKLLKPLYALSATAVVLAAILLIGVAKHVAALQSGQELIIPARGYDPRAILLGRVHTQRATRVCKRVFRCCWRCRLLDWSCPMVASEARRKAAAAGMTLARREQRERERRRGAGALRHVRCRVSKST